MPQRRRYTKQFKEEAIRLSSQEGVRLTQIAQDLGIDAGLLRRWCKDAETLGPKAFRGKGYAHDEEVAKLKRELGRVKRERDFLRDAAAYFAKESKRGFSA
ncbi:MAG: transposase [Nitrospirales bacterium]